MAPSTRHPVPRFATPPLPPLPPPPALSGLLATAGHDLRQPFQAMRLFLHLLETRVTDPAARELTGKLGAALDQGTAQLEGLLAYAALAAGPAAPGPAPSPGPVPAGPLLARLTEEFAPRAAAKGLTLRVVPSRAVLRTDPVLLDRMLRDLLDNAVRETQHGGILLGLRRRGDRAAVTVLDSGPGLPETLWVAGGTPTPGTGRLGLGLARVRLAATLLGHGLELRSVAGRGTGAAVVVPLARAAPDADAGSITGDTTEAGGDGPPTVAVAEDDRLQLASLQDMLETWGYLPVAAPDADELMRALEAHPAAPSLILADHRLRSHTGRITAGPDLIAAIRARHGPGIPALLITGDTHPDIRAEAAAAGLTLLAKPLHPHRLRDAVEKALGTRRR